MNKVVLTHDRASMAIVGPSACGKTNLMFNMVRGLTFYPRYKKVCYFCKEYKEPFTDVQRQLPHIEFIKFSGSEITKKLPNCFLIFDNSCKEIFNYKEFIKLQHLADIENCLLFLLSTVCFTRASCLVQLT